MTLPELMREARALNLPPGRHDFRCTPGAFELLALEMRQRGAPMPTCECCQRIVLVLTPGTAIELAPGAPN